jgi:hypothetical protein
MAIRTGKKVRPYCATRHQATVERMRPGERVAQLSTTLGRDRRPTGS